MFKIATTWKDITLSLYKGSGTEKDHGDGMKRNISSEALENGGVVQKVSDNIQTCKCF